MLVAYHVIEKVMSTKNWELSDKSKLASAC